MKEKLQQLLARVDQMTLRERVLVFLACLTVVYVLWNELLYRPMDTKRRQLIGQLETLEQNVQGLNEQIGVLARTRSSDPDAGDRKRLESLRTRLADLDGQLTRVTHHLIPPDRMASMLEAVLTRQAPLEVVKLEGLGATPVLAPGADTATIPAVNLFKHGLRIDFTGGYLDTVRYLRAVEALDWRVLWDDVTYTVELYPLATVSITVYSLSLDEAWIGV